MIYKALEKTTVSSRLGFLLYILYSVYIYIYRRQDKITNTNVSSKSRQHNCVIEIKIVTFIYIMMIIPRNF